jgi:tetratricopeptide (TPR) repeat protein
MTRLWIFLLVFGGLANTLLFAQTPPNPVTAKPAGPAPSQAWQDAYNKAVAFLQEKKFAEALLALDEADKIDPSQLAGTNLRGAIYTEKKEYAKAEPYFQKAAELDPKNFGPRFNLGEVQFLQKRYPEARQRFEVLSKENPKDELVRYKIYLCYLLEGQEAQAKQLLGGFDFASTTPAYYFANAAWEFYHKNPAAARGWIVSALDIYNAKVNEIFADSLIELNWYDPEAPTGDVELAAPRFLPNAGDAIEPMSPPTTTEGSLPTPPSSSSLFDPNPSVIQGLPDIDSEKKKP